MDSRHQLHFEFQHYQERPLWNIKFVTMRTEWYPESTVFGHSLWSANQLPEQEVKVRSNVAIGSNRFMDLYTHK
ncbi:hypothetical protein WN51_05018 [Melipona quadrifasciata]|uniref:Uncharacterized protein n=1 Tax=Melipona quadrifasciata TaxID=166423 RepID=A0A0M8ZU94_9HYME|nr:hypothetical protein WN51_05018 [Melipona quadrifasciata]